MAASREYVDKILANYAAAAEANLNTPGRRGCTVWLADDSADDVMVTGDVHGNCRNFDLIGETAALEEYPRRHLVLQEACHGGPTYKEGGGCMSHVMLEAIAALKVKYPSRVHFLLGNHELSELSDYPIQKNRRLLNLLFRIGLCHVYGPDTDEVHQALLHFLRSCPLAVRVPWGVLISHSLPDEVDRRGFDPAIFDRELAEDDFREQSDVFRLLWGRDYRRENAEAFCRLIGVKMLVTGHEPCREGFISPNQRQIILDCCGPMAAYLILPVGAELAFAEAMERVSLLGEENKS